MTSSCRVPHFEPLPHNLRPCAGATLPAELQQAAQETLAAVANPIPPQPPAAAGGGASSSNYAGAGMDASWAHLGDGLLSTDLAAAAAAQAWLLQLLIAAAQRHQQEAPGDCNIFAGSTLT